MLWMFLALLAHVANGAVFIVDKSLLAGKSTLGKPLQYALYSAALASCVIVIAPFVPIVATPFVVMWSVITGCVHILALYVFFVAMRFGEPSRVVPITGSAVPMFTLLLAVMFLGEVFTAWQFVGIILLVVGGGLLTLRPHLASPRTRGGNLLLPVLAGALFAAYFVITKYMYTYAEADFLPVFMATRVVEGVIAVCGIFVFIGVPLSPWGERASRFSGRVRAVPRRGVSFLFISNKVLAAGAFALQSYAISLGSVSVVNALQGVQFAIVFIVAILFSVFFPKIFKEDMRPKTLVQKSLGIILLSIGITLIA